jgi:hypothetical protein
LAFANQAEAGFVREQPERVVLAFKAVGPIAGDIQVDRPESIYFPEEPRCFSIGEPG